MRWRLKRNGEFNVCSFYASLWGSSTVLLLWKGSSGVKAPIEGLFFGVPGGKALTCKNFIKRAIC